jgi:hypothetical protein
VHPSDGSDAWKCICWIPETDDPIGSTRAVILDFAPADSKLAEKQRREIASPLGRLYGVSKPTVSRNRRRVPAEHGTRIDMENDVLPA